MGKATWRDILLCLAAHILNETKGDPYNALLFYLSMLSTYHRSLSSNVLQSATKVQCCQSTPRKRSWPRKAVQDSSSLDGARHGLHHFKMQLDRVAYVLMPFKTEPAFEINDLIY